VLGRESEPAAAAAAAAVGAEGEGEGEELVRLDEVFCQTQRPGWLPC
jgi:hypothetical protein